MCINAAQDELHFLYTCIQQSFQNNLKERNDEETSTTFYSLVFTANSIKVDIDNSQMCNMIDRVPKE